MTSGDLKLRRAERTDAEAVFALTRGFSVSFKPERASFDVSFPHLLNDENAFLIVASTDDRVCGYLLGFVHVTLFANGRVAWVEEVMIDPGFRRRGMGRALLDEFEGWANSRNARFVALATRRAPEFYRAARYQESAIYYRKLLKSD
ncbi:GNAT family N-acetyltransferase [Rhizohabitans arisaemae]|uniref:GNAT family N-acetyltransferase n=1 Tax=Rhizohabitans arisaemae TaxID=2720610 RepID=UPI0024B0710D|nr:GNAT family N-acetyltransferase [Rhizohabitans arisaemae]